MVIAADRWPVSIEIYTPRRIYRDIAGFSQMRYIHLNRG